MKGSSWLQEHLNTFVKPYLGHIPEYAVEHNHFTAAEKTVIKNVWRSVKAQAKGKQLILAGRDVYIWEILAKRENFPTMFLPECSRETVWAMKSIPKDVFLFDTGFIGSIPKALGISSFSLMSYIANENDAASKQTFPKLTGSRGLALKVEYTPKYWQTGRLVDGIVVQNLAKKEEFEKAVQVTYEIYKDSSPKFQEELDLRGRRRYSWKHKESSLNLW